MLILRAHMRDELLTYLSHIFNITQWLSSMKTGEQVLIIGENGDQTRGEVRQVTKEKIKVKVPDGILTFSRHTLRLIGYPFGGYTYGHKILSAMATKHENDNTQEK